MALRKLLGGKLHRATVTEANVDYEGSITLPPELIEAAGFHEFEQVWVWNVTSGTRFLTYVMVGKDAAAGAANEIAVNGAAAHLVKPGHLVIIANFLELNESELPNHKPRIVFVDGQNKIRELRPEQLPGK